MESTVTLLLASAIRVGGQVGSQEVVKISDQDRERLTAAQARVKAALAGKPFQHGGSTFEINVIGVRTATTKGRLRQRVHEEFIIRTRRAGQPDVYVSRRYGDFERLADTLRLEFPDEDITRPPPKDRTNLEVASPFQAPQDDSTMLQPRESMEGLPGSLDNLNLRGEKSSVASTSTSSPASGARPGPPTGPLAREKNRLTLRAYIRALLAIPPVADSPVLADFLLGEPTTLTAAEDADARSREALDAIRSDEAGRFNDEAAQRVTQLQQHLSAFKADLVQRDGLSRVFATVKSTPRMEDLPESYRALLSWARISAASTLFHLFMGSDTSSDLFGQLKRIHGLMPYFMMRQVLRISNPVSMIRGVIDLFLAQPFGQRSLLQRMFSSSLQEEAKELSEMIEAVKSKVEDDTLCEKVRLYVNAPMDVQKLYKKDAEQERVDLLTIILRSPEQPKLDRSQIHRVIRASRAYEVYKQYRAGLKNNEEDQGPQDDDAWLYEDLHVLLRLMTRLRDKEQMLSLIFEGVTSELLKDIVTIFYSPLAQVYKAANIADSLYDFQVFINDLIKTVEANEELSYTDPQKTVQVFIDLVARHEGRFYAFVHQVHSKGSGLFDGLMHWIELFLNFVRSGDPTDSSSHQRGQASSAVPGTVVDESAQRQGLGEVDLEVCLPAGGTDRRVALAEIDALVVYAYRLKLLRELKLRRKIADREVKGAGEKAKVGIGFAGGGSEEDEGAFLSTMVDNLGMEGGTFMTEMEDVEAEDEFDDDDEEDEEGQGEGPEAHQATRSSSDTEEDSDSNDDVFLPTNEEADPESSPQKNRSSGWRPAPLVRGESLMTIVGPVTPTVEKALPSIPDTSQSVGTKKKKPKALKPKPPVLKVIPEMVPLFVELVRPMLRPARTASDSDTLPSTATNGSIAGGEATPATSGGWTSGWW